MLGIKEVARWVTISAMKSWKAEGFTAALTALKSLKESDPPWSPDHRFSYVKFDRAEVNMEALNGEHADPVAVLKASFAVDVDET